MEQTHLSCGIRSSGFFSAKVAWRIAVFLTAASLIVSAVVPAYASDGAASGGSVSDVRFSVTGLRVVIEYDLQGDRDAEYSVAVELRNRIDPSFRYSPKALTGDIGLGKYAGNNRRIVWDMSREFPQGLQGTGYYFVVKAEEIKTGHSTGILDWIGASAVAVAAVVTYVIVMRNGGPTSPASYPAPPGRP